MERAAMADTSLLNASASAVSAAPRRFNPDDTDQQAEISKAAWQLEDAIAEKVCEKYPDSLEARCKFFNVLTAQKWYDRALMAMIILTIFETPTWCDTSHTWNFGDPLQRCRHGKHEVMLSGITYLPPGYALMFEVAILACLAYKLYLEFELQNKHFNLVIEKQEEIKKIEDETTEKEKQPGQYFPIWKIKFCVFMITLELVDVLVFAHFRPVFRCAFLSRTALLCMLPSVIKLFKCISKILVEVGTVAVFFVGTLFFFAWVSVMIFNGMDDPPEHFQTFGQAFYGLFVAGVCDEFTDILLKSYTAYRWIGIVWFIFLVIVHLLFLSLVLDTLCAGYMKSEEEETEEMIEEKAKAILKAFKFVNEATEDVPHKISKDAFMAFLKEYTKSPGVPWAPTEYAGIYLDRLGKQEIDEEEFSKICALTQYRMWWTRKDSRLSQRFPAAWARTSDFRESVRNPDGMFEKVMMGVLGVNFVLVVIETAYDLNDWDEPAWTEWLEFVFSFVYLGECMTKIGVTGWDYYTSSISNKFDFFTTMLLLATSVFESLIGSFSTYANILRLFRLLRVVKQLKSLDKVQFMADTVIKLVSKAKDMLILLLVVIFGFTVLSVELFGGLLYESNDLLEGTSYHEEKEFVLNFNDFLMAFGLWFVNLLCEYKPSFAAAINRTSSIPHAWLLFGLFWAIAVCITFELVKAFTIEVYMDLKKKWDKKKKKDKGESLEEDANAPDVLKVIAKHFDEEGLRLWYSCLVVDEEEWDDVVEKILENVAEEREEEQLHAHAHCKDHI